MLPATLLSPSDNKPLQRALESILGAFTTPSDNATMPGHSTRAAQQASSSTAGHRLHQLTRAHQVTRWQLRPPQATDSPKTQQNQAKISHFLRLHGVYIYCTCIPKKMPFLEPFRYIVRTFPLQYCMENQFKLIKVGFWVFPHACATPLPLKILSPLFFLAVLAVFL